ncbi:MAG: NAD(P)H-hydrate dehydratase [Blastochloris sp.]|nr:NAD(P)H-hydrate dehydratase [Blastochloris sp.]
MKILTCSEMQALEAQAFQAGLKPVTLMQRAVEGMLADWKRRFPRPGQAIFFCGKGNNGNDGLWLADCLVHLGWQVEIVTSHPAEERKEVSCQAVQHALSTAKVWSSLAFCSNPSFSLKKHPRIIVDALLGLGSSDSPHGVCLEMLEAMRSLKSQASMSVSIDLPSGLDPQTGIPSPDTFPADLTYSLGFMKHCLLMDVARPYVGRLQVIALDLEKYVEANNTDLNADFFTLQEARNLTKQLTAETYKGKRGTLHCWAGSESMRGAAQLVSHSGLRSGAGLVRLYSHSSLSSPILPSCPEIITGTLSSKAIPQTFMEAKAWVLGPGIGVDEESLRILTKLLEQAPCPIVLDADALSLVACDLPILNACAQPIILTPHRGELERLLHQPAPERQEAASLWLQQHPQTILVAKGPNTLVAAQNQTYSFNASGSPGMATAGMGDVLAGMIGSLLAQGYAPWDAARLGVYWHGKAADHAVEKLGEQCLTASDVLSSVAPAWKKITNQY